MKRVFSVIISLFTVYIPKKLGYERIRKDPPLQEAAQSEKKVSGEGAKYLGSGENVQKYSPAIRAAQEFIWNHLPERTQDWFATISLLPEPERKSLYKNGLLCYLDGRFNDGVITQEIAVLFAPDTAKNSNTEALNPA